MKYIIFIAGIFFWIRLSGQTADSLTLDFCYNQSIENFPLIKQKELLDQATALKIKNLNTSYFPQIFLNAQATYQSDVTEISLPIPTLKLPEIYKDQYKATIDINQTLWDGGVTGKQKQIENISLQVDQQNLEVQLYALKDRINQIFFSVILLQESRKLLQVSVEDIKAKLAKIESGIKNGVMMETNADVLKAQLLNLDGQMIEVNSGIRSGLNMLGEFINKKLSDDSKLFLPQITIDVNRNEINRPEYKLYELQQSKLDAMKGLTNTRTMPRIMAFGQAGYGRPGLNMLSNEFDSFWMVGLKLSWNIWNWNQNKNDRQWYDIQNNIISSQKETLEKNIKIFLAKDLKEIIKYETLIEKDHEIIAICEKILKATSSQFENGVITSTEYLTELNSKTQAEINLKSHIIQLVKAKINYLNNLGKL
ncbi:MAG: TolC family protein [Bacteroidia bacterium]|nr:TolC family protein [Bacteroidia bacterium]